MSGEAGSLSKMTTHGVPPADCGLLAKVKADHDKVRALFKEIKCTELTEQKRDAIMRDIVKELSIHAAVEERVVYPVMKERLPGGEKEFTESLQEHQRQKDVLNQLDGMSTTDAKWAELFSALIRDTEAHMTEEEIKRFPDFLQNLPEQDRCELAKNYDSAKSTAPSHPHPSAPSKGPLVGAAQVAAAGVDAIRDASRSAMTSLGEKTKGTKEVTPEQQARCPACANAVSQCPACAKTAAQCSAGAKTTAIPEKAQ